MHTIKLHKWRKLGVITRNNNVRVHLAVPIARIEAGGHCWATIADSGRAASREISHLISPAHPANAGHSG